MSQVLTDCTHAPSAAQRKRYDYGQFDRRRARLNVPGYIESRGEPILNPVTGAEHRVRIDSPSGFEFRLAEMGRGWSKTHKPLTIDLADSYGQFCELNLSQSGVVG